MITIKKIHRYIDNSNLYIILYIIIMLIVFILKYDGYRQNTHKYSENYYYDLTRKVNCITNIFSYVENLRIVDSKMPAKIMIHSPNLQQENINFALKDIVIIDLNNKEARSLNFGNSTHFDDYKNFLPHQEDYAFNIKDKHIFIAKNMNYSIHNSSECMILILDYYKFLMMKLPQKKNSISEKLDTDHSLLINLILKNTILNSYLDTQKKQAWYKFIVEYIKFDLSSQFIIFLFLIVYAKQLRKNSEKQQIILRKEIELKQDFAKNQRDICNQLIRSNIFNLNFANHLFKAETLSVSSSAETSLTEDKQDIINTFKDVLSLTNAHALRNKINIITEFNLTSANIEDATAIKLLLMNILLSVLRRIPSEGVLKLVCVKTSPYCELIIYDNGYKDVVLKKVEENMLFITLKEFTALCTKRQVIMKTMSSEEGFNKTCVIFPMSYHADENISYFIK